MRAQLAEPWTLDALAEEAHLSRAHKCTSLAERQAAAGHRGFTCATIRGSQVWFCSDEHTTFAPPRPVGERVRLVPAHIDPTMACHERAFVFSGDEMVDVWPIDLRGW